ncbi:MAG: response regulator transcription factor, partial [Acidimicrobiales bacterium]
HAEPDFVLSVFEDGNEGVAYLLKEHVGDRAELARAVEAVATGGSAVDPDVVSVLVDSRSGRSQGVDGLTPRETEVLALIAEGWNNAAIAERLVLSDRAVAKHINSIFSKLHLGEEPEVHRRVRAVLAWLSQ